MNTGILAAMFLWVLWASASWTPKPKPEPDSLGDVWESTNPCRCSPGPEL